MNRQLNIDLPFQNNQLYDPNKKDNYDLDIINEEVTNKFDEFEAEDYYDSSNPFDDIRKTFVKPGFLPRVDIEEDEIDRDDIIFDIDNFNNDAFRVQEDVLNPIYEKTDANEDDLKYSIFAKESYTNMNNRKDIENYKYIDDFSSEKYSTHVSDSEVVFAIKGSDPSGTALEGTSDIIKNIGIAFSLPSANDSNIIKSAGGLVSSLIVPAIGATAIATGAIVSAPLVTGVAGISALSLIGSGLLYNDLNNFQNELDKIEKKYPDKKIVVTGHSQGGTYSNLLGIKNKDYDVYTFNAGRGLPNLYNNLKCKYGDCTNIKNYRIVGDFASATPDFTSEGKTFNLKPKIPDGQTLLESKSAETSLFVPADLYIPHNIRNFQDRTPNNLMPDYGLYGRTLSRRLAIATGVVGTGLGYSGIKGLAKLSKETLPKIGKQLVKLATAMEIAKTRKQIPITTTRKPSLIYNVDETFGNKIQKFGNKIKTINKSNFYEPKISKEIGELTDTEFNNQIKERLKKLSIMDEPGKFIPYNVKSVRNPPKSGLKTQIEIDNIMQSNFNKFNEKLTKKFKKINNKRDRLYNKLKLNFENEKNLPENKSLSTKIRKALVDVESKPKQDLIEKEINEGIDTIEKNVKESADSISKFNIALGGIATGGVAEIFSSFGYDANIKPVLYENLERF